MIKNKEPAIDRSIHVTPRFVNPVVSNLSAAGAVDVPFSAADGNTVTLTASQQVDQAVAGAWVKDQITGDFETFGVRPPELGQD